MFNRILLATLVPILDLPSKRDERGATAVEYGLMLSLIAAVIAGAVAELGTKVLGCFALMSGLWP